MKETNEFEVSRRVLQSSTTFGAVCFFMGMALLSGVLFLSGALRLGEHLALPDPALRAVIGSICFALFLPWFVTLYSVRHLLASIKRLEAKLDELEHRATWQVHADR